MYQLLIELCFVIQSESFLLGGGVHLAYSWKHVHAQSCPTLCDPMDSSLTGSSVHGILQTRILEWSYPHKKKKGKKERNTQSWLLNTLKI